MRVQQRRARRVAAGLVTLMLTTWLTSAADGGIGKRYTYSAFVPCGQDRQGCSLTIDIQPVLFYLMTLQNKYQIALIQIVNRTDSRKNAPLRLSRTRDKIELRFGAKTIPGELNLSDTDAQLWDGLDQSMRQALAYPPKVEGGEQEAIFIFIPVDAMRGFAGERVLPTEFRYTIDCLGKTFELQPPHALD